MTIEMIYTGYVLIGVLFAMTMLALDYERLSLIMRYDNPEIPAISIILGAFIGCIIFWPLMIMARMGR